MKKLFTLLACVLMTESIVNAKEPVNGKINTNLVGSWIIPTTVFDNNATSYVTSYYNYQFNADGTYERGVFVLGIHIFEGKNDPVNCIKGRWFTADGNLIMVDDCQKIVIPFFLRNDKLIMRPEGRNLELTSLN